jgi:hypothetical protein
MIKQSNKQRRAAGLLKQPKSYVGGARCRGSLELICKAGCKVSALLDFDDPHGGDTSQCGTSRNDLIDFDVAMLGNDAIWTTHRACLATFCSIREIE